MDSKNLPWPALNDDLLELGDDWTNNACLNLTSDELGIYSQGYKEAADRLCAQLQKDRTEIDFLIYPLIFLYRHHIELQLKIIIKDGSYLLNNKSEMPNHHTLHQLWHEAKEIIEELWPNGSKKDLTAVKNIIMQLHDLDPGSYAFRYDQDKQGNKPNPNLENIDIKNFSAVIDNLSTFLDGVGLAISSYIEQEEEMKRNLSP